MLVDQVWGGVTNTKVPEPVGGDGQGHRLGTDVEREDFTGDDPSNGTPRRGEERNVDANESDQNLLSGNVRGRNRDTNDGNQELANAHAGGTHQEQPPSTEPLHTPHAREGHEHVDDVGGDGDQEGVRNARVLEEHGPIVEDEVDSGQLLPRLNEDAGEGAKADFVVRGTEAVEVRRFVQLLLVVESNADLIEFGQKFGMVWGKGDQARESTGSIFIAALLDKPSR